MSRLMQGYIEEQGAMIRSMLDARKSLSEAFVEAYRDRDLDRIFLIGSGSSYHSGLMAQHCMESLLGTEVSAQVPTRMTAPALISARSALYIVISQSGTSTNSFSVVRRLRQAGRPVVAVTESHDSPLAREADLHVLNGCGEERIGPKTKGVTGTVVTLDLLALELALARGRIDGDTYNRRIESFYRYAANLDENIRRSLSWYERNLPTLRLAPQLAVLGQGDGYGTALEAALKLLETLYRPVYGYEFEEFLHGIACMLDESSQLLFLLPSGEARERALRLSAFCASKGAACYHVSLGGADGDGRTLCLLSAEDEFIEPLELLIPGQILSAQLSEVFGNNIDQPKYAGFSKIMASKLQMG